jgi:predicted RNase H-like HicB family nuclease
VSETQPRSMIVVPICIEPDDTGYVGYSPDLRGCVVGGETREEVRLLLEEAVRLHLASYPKRGDRLPAGCHVTCGDASSEGAGRDWRTGIRIKL